MGPSRHNFPDRLARPKRRAPLETKCDVGELLCHDLQLVDQFEDARSRLYVVDEEEHLVQLVVELCDWDMILGFGLEGVEPGFLLNAFPCFSCRLEGVPQVMHSVWHRYRFSPQHLVHRESMPELHRHLVVVVRWSRRTRCGGHSRF